jgi:hypothetical protein
MEHTQGHWYYYTNQYGTEVKTKKYIKNKFKGQRATKICSVHRWNANEKANARLIASAPTMLKVLQELYLTLEQTKGMEIEAAAVKLTIEQATGER